MDRTESGPKTPCSQSSTTTPLQENDDLLSPLRCSKRLQKDLLENKKSNGLPVSKKLSNDNITENDSTAQIADSIGKSCCNINSQCDSREPLFGLFDQEIDHSPGLNHKFYGCKRKGYPSPCSESFGLPDDPIFSNSPIFLDRTTNSPLDINLADPWDISVVGLENVDQPWLVEYPEVITPYWDVESLFPFEVDDIRQKIEPACDLTKQNDSFDISSSILDDSESDNVFTSTPIKNQNNSTLSVVSTINITNGEDTNVNIAALKDEVLKALEEAIKKKSTIGNIDMKIQIVSSDPKSPVISPKKSSVEVRINENVETESCKSSSSSKENYFVETAREKSEKIISTKELGTLTLSDLNEDWQDSPGSEVTDQSQNELDSVQNNSAKKSKKLVKNRKNHVLGVRRSLRTKEINVSTTSNKEAITGTSAQLCFEDSLMHASNSKADQLINNIPVSNEISQQTIEIDLVGKKKGHSDSKRSLRSSYSHKAVSQSDSDISKNIKKSKNKDLQPQDKDVFVVKQREMPSGEGLQFNQVTDSSEFADRCEIRNRLRNYDSQSSQDECDSNDPVSRNRKKRVKRAHRHRDFKSSQEQDNIEKTSVEKRRRSGRLINIDLQTCQNGLDGSGGEQTSESKFQDECHTSKFISKKSENQATLQFSQNDMIIGRDLPKQNQMPINQQTLSSQDESVKRGKSIKKMEIERTKTRERFQNDSQSSQNDNDITKNILENSIYDPLQLSQTDLRINISVCKKLGKSESSLKDLQSTSQDESDVSKDDPARPKRKGRPSKVKGQEKPNDLLINTNESSINMTNKSIKNKIDSTKDQIEDTLSTKRILRPRPPPLKPTAKERKEGRRRTVSSSAFESGPKEQNYGFPARTRSVSANYDNKTARTPIRRSLRSHATEQTKPFANVKSPQAFQNMKSPKITFNLTNSFKESPRKFETDSPIKSILKNVYDSGGRLIGVKVHREKQLKMMPSALDIKPEDKDDTTPSKERLKHSVIIPTTELELNAIKKEEEDFLRENGITSRIKIVISPLEIKEENDDTIGKMCPILPLVVPKIDVPPLRKSGRFSNVTQENIDNNKSENVVKSGINMTPQKISDSKSEDTGSSKEISNAIHQKRTKRNNGKINSFSEKTNSAEAKEIKIEETCYNLGNFVWAQVGKYPYWPAIVCYDPITQTFQKEVIKQNMIPQIYYHLRFFGDHGRRAWIYRKHIMLYCSNQDLEQVANKLKSESKNVNIVKPYLVTGSLQMIEKWHKAVEELNLLKKKKYGAIIKHMLESYEEHLNNRKKRRSYMTDASSESESEEPDISENKSRKRFKSSAYLPHVTADEQVIDNPLQNKHSEGFDEINITVGVQNIEVAIGSLENAVAQSSTNTHNLEVANDTLNREDDRRSIKGPEDLNVTTPQLSDELAEKVSESAQISDISDKVTPRRSRRSLKSVETLHVTAESQDSILDIMQHVDNSEPSEASNESSVKLGERKSLRGPKNSFSNEASSSQSVENEKVLSRPSKKQPDETSEAESKTSSNSDMYSFKYQMDLHKRNNLFNGLTKVRVCDYCLKPGDLYKCKGKCGGFFHLDCASKVTQPHSDRRAKKREKSPRKAKGRSAAPSVESTPKSNRSDEGCRTRNQCQVQIITIKSKHAIGTPQKVNLPANFDELSLSEQIDYGMKEMMSKFENRTIYLDSTDSSSEEGSIIASKNKQLEILDSPASSVAVESEKSAAKSSDLDENVEEEKNLDDLEVSTLSDNAAKKLIKHVTADSVILTESEIPMDITNLRCTFCRVELDPPCFACGLEVSERGSSSRRKCSQFRCGRYYHPYCLKMWPQTQWSIGKWSRNQEQEDNFTCPAHTCHTCFSEELGSAACRLPGDKLARCMLCPAGFHTTTFCIPAGTDILGGSQIVCPRHRPKQTQPINTIWCFICSEGGNLICCDTCPTSVHPECQPINLTDDDKYICEDCESGRFPLYDEIVWVKLGQYRWWPAIVLFPNEIPENVKALKHQRGDFAVRFFGTNDHYWVNKARSFLFQEGDRGGSPGEANKSKNKVYETFGQAIEDAALAYKLKKEFKLRREAESINSLKPPTYVKINKNKPVGNVKSLELDLSNATACECDPNKSHPCGPDDNCINRLLMTECDPDVCPAGIRCRNQSFQKREYPPMIPYKTQGRGWGLKCLAPIQKGQFVIEYVGDLIDSEEYQRRIQKMHEQKEENYYFMTVDSDRMIDAGPKGNLSRFMNHCCNPNCVTQKWTVRGDTRVGLFAKCDIESGSELTFNYNLEVVGQEKKVCKCGAGNCSGFIGVKAKSDKTDKPQTDPVTEPSEPRIRRKYNKKRAVSPPMIPPCFMCGRKQSDVTCNNKFCNKGYHMKCLKLEEMPEVTKFTCPRHNCNICSNRTIRCCVKCTNSFCPSHSEGNVRHDKFLGFVCRLHDPGISSTKITSSSVQRKNVFSVKTKSKNKSIYSYPPEKREAIRAAWRMYKRQEYDRKKIVKTNRSNKKHQSSSGKKSIITQAKQTSKTLARTFEKSTKDPTSTQQQNHKITLKTFKAENSNSLNNTVKKYLLGMKYNKGIYNIPHEDREVVRATWRERKRQSRLKQKDKLNNEKLNTKEVPNIIIDIQPNIELINDQKSDEISIQQKKVSNDQTMPNVKDNVLEIAHDSVSTYIQVINITDKTEAMKESDPNIQNNLVTSENHDNTNDIPDVTESTRSEFEPFKSTKRRRPKPDSTDESAVSSTTSDEDSNLTSSHKARQKETTNTENNGFEIDELVSSTPPKEPTVFPEPKELQEGNINTSEDEITLEQRVKRRSGVRNPRKKIRINVKSLVSTARTS